MRNSLRPDDGVRHEEPTSGNFGKDEEYHRDQDSDGYDTASLESEAQAGVKRIEAVSKAWTKTSLIIAYVTYVKCWCMTFRADQPC